MTDPQWERVVPDPTRYWLPNPAASPGARFEDLIFVSGQVARDSSGALVGKGDVVAQLHQVLDNVASVLEAAGATLADIIKLTSYLVDPADLRPMLEARRERFAGRVPPSASVIVQALPDPDWLVEVDAIAVRRRP